MSSVLRALAWIGWCIVLVAPYLVLFLSKAPLGPLLFFHLAALLAAGVLIAFSRLFFFALGTSHEARIFVLHLISLVPLMPSLVYIVLLLVSLSRGA